MFLDHPWLNYHVPKAKSFIPSLLLWKKWKHSQSIYVTMVPCYLLLYPLENAYADSYRSCISSRISSWNQVVFRFSNHKLPELARLRSLKKDTPVLHWSQEDNMGNFMQSLDVEIGSREIVHAWLEFLWNSKIERVMLWK